MSSKDEIAKRYHQDFGEGDYNNAVHSLWEDHCKYGRNGNVPSWPPTLQQVEKAVEDEQSRRAWEHDRR